METRNTSIVWYEEEHRLCKLKEWLETVRDLDDSVEEGRTLSEINRVLCDLRRFDEAAACCREHVVLCTTLADPREQCATLYDLASLHHARGKYLLLNSRKGVNKIIVRKANSSSGVLNLAIQYYRTHLSFTRQLKLRSEEGKTLGHIGHIYCLLGKFSTGLKYLNERLNIAYELGDLPAQRRVCTNLANTYILQGNLSLAAGYHCKALEVSMRMRDKVLEAQCYFSIATSHLISGNHTKALANLRKHLELTEELDDQNGECWCHWAMGKAMISLGDLQGAFVSANKHLNVASKLNRGKHIRVARRNISNIGKILFVQNKAMKNRLYSEDSNTQWKQKLEVEIHERLI